MPFVIAAACIDVKDKDLSAGLSGRLHL